MVTAIGIILGIGLAASLAYAIAAFILLKSNDYGDTPQDLQQYTGYDPIQLDYVGSVSGYGGDSFGTGINFRL